MAGLETRQATDAIKAAEQAKQDTINARAEKGALYGVQDLEQGRRGVLGATELEWTDQGAMGINPVTGTAQPIMAGNKAIMPGVTPGSGARDFAHRDKINLLRKFGGYSDAEATEIVIAGGLGDSEANALAQKVFDNMGNSDKIMVGGVAYRKRQIAADPALRQQAVEELAYSFSSRSKAGALAQKPESVRATEGVISGQGAAAEERPRKPFELIGRE
jgi:hypothetical protein